MKNKLLSPRRITAAHAFLLGALLAALSLAPAILPYGGRFVTRGDFIEQQLSFILETKRILNEGLSSYSFSTFLGAPAVGSYAFYTLGSVFVWPLALLPDTLIPFGITVMAILKHAAGTAIAFCYFRRLMKDERLALLGGVLYMFSAFTIVNTQFYHFAEVIAFFPLILLGLEIAMSDHPHPGLLALFCGINALTNYYFMLSSAILAALYFVFRFFSEDWKPHRSLRRVIPVVFECGVGCALSGVLLLPAMHFMLSITRGGVGIALTQTYSPITLLERLRTLLMPIESNVVHAYYGDADSWSSTAAYLPVFGLTGVFAFFSGKRHRWLKALIAVLLVCSCVPILCGAFALFTNVSYTRWWYGLVLMMTLATLYALRDIRLTARAWRVSFALCCAMTLVLTVPFLLPQETAQALLERGGMLAGYAQDVLDRRGGAYASDPFRILSIALTLLGAGGMLAILIKRPRFAAMLTLVCAIACVQYAGYIAVGDRFLLSGGTEPQNGVYELDEIADPMLGALELEAPEEYYRIDYSRKLRNYGLIRGQSALTCFTSLRSSTVGRFTQMAGFGSGESPTATPPDKDPALRALLSVKEYHQLESEEVPEGFVRDREENGFPVYVNENYIPMGFLQTTFTGSNDQPMNEDTVAPTMLAAAVLYPEDIDAHSDRMQRLDVYAIPDWQESTQRLQQNACDRFETNATGFTAHIDAREAGLLVFTIPYDKGFSAAVDGEAAQIVCCDISFMAVWVEPGEHEIAFTYHTRSLDLGVAMSLTAAGILLIYVLCCRKRRIRARAL